MKTIVAYSSKTGNTKRVGEAIAKHYTIESFAIENLSDHILSDIDQIILGSWVDKGLPEAKTREMITRLHNKKVGIFLTLGADPHSEHAVTALDRFEQLVEEQHNQVVARFICQGKIDPRLTEMFKKLGDASPHKMDETRIARHKEAAKHPDEQDLQQAIDAFSSIVAE